MSYGFYKVLHLLGVLGVFVSLGGLILHARSDGSKKFKGRRLAMITHGLGLVLIFVAGFGLMARIGIVTDWPLWIYLKVTIWFLLGLGIAIIPRKPTWAPSLWFVILALGATAAWLANYKPT